MRTSRGSCESCGGFDQIQVERRGGGIETRNLPNYSYPTNLLPSPIERDDESAD
jgi:hypothetical protein